MWLSAWPQDALERGLELVLMLVHVILLELVPVFVLTFLNFIWAWAWAWALLCVIRLNWIVNTM